MTASAPEKNDHKTADRPDTRPSEEGERPRRSRSPDGRAGDSGTDGRAVRRRSGARALNARKAAQIAAREVLELTGRRPEHVISVAKDEDGWKVGIEVVELHRIPDTADVLAVYQVCLDARGELVSYGREQRYRRASTEEG